MIIAKQSETKFLITFEDSDRQTPFIGIGGGSTFEHDGKQYVAKHVDSVFNGQLYYIVEVWSN